MDLSDLLAWPQRADVPGMLYRRLLPRHALRGLSGLSRAEQVLWLTCELVHGVSEAGGEAPLTPAALRELGHGALAELLEGQPAGEARRAALAAEVERRAPALIESLVDWAHAHQERFSLVNSGLAAFAPVEVSAAEGVDGVLRLGAEQVVPALYARVVGRRAGAVSAHERAFVLGAFAFGELSDEGGVSYLFCAQASAAVEARAALVGMRAGAAAAVVGRAIAALPAPFPVEVGARREALAGLSVDAQTRLRALQWEMDALRPETLEALVSWAREHRRSFQ